MSAPELQPGARIGKFEILAHIATGGMGQVYKARDLELGRTVALKVLSAEVARTPESVERFRREARHAARLRHKNIVTLYEFGQADGQWFLAMEYVKGIDLEAYVIRKGQLDPEEARRALRQAAQALDHAWRQGVVHRDVKPANLLLTREDGRALVKLTDFGLARVEGEAHFRLTRDGSTVGTIDYLAPEQARDSASADVRSDIYSLGCTCYHMLAGQPPFAEGGLGERVLKHLEAEPPDVRTINPRVSAPFWEVLRKMLAKQPEDRYQTPAELLEDLDRIKRGEAPLNAERGLRPTGSQAGKGAGAPSPSPSAFRTPNPEESESVTRLGLPVEQLRSAAGQFERAQQARDAGSLSYALELLLSCCRLDPANLTYRQALRQVGRSLADKDRPGALAALATRLRLKGACRRHDGRKVLEYGESLLVRNPADTGTQKVMAEAAEELGLDSLAVWLLEQAREQAPDNAAVLRQLARVNERLGRLSRALELWQMIRKIDPSDAEAPRKLNALAASEAIARGGYAPPQ
jgi:serine/threonine protein kinase